jgi:hypothetical protein
MRARPALTTAITIRIQANAINNGIGDVCNLGDRSGADLTDPGTQSEVFESPGLLL